MSSLFLLLSTLSLVYATPWDQLLSDLPSVRYGDASVACNCQSSARQAITTFTSQEGYKFTLNSAISGDCTNPVTSFSLTAATQTLTQAMFFVEYANQCPSNQDCSQVRCTASSPGAQTLSCSFAKPAGYTNQMGVYVLWQTTSASGNRQYPLPVSFIPLNFDCSATSSYSSTCNNGVCGCNAGDIGSTCPIPVIVTSPPATSAPVTATSAPVTATSAPVTATSAPVTATSAPVSGGVSGGVSSGGVSNGPTPTPTPVSTGPRMIFQDEFNKLDFSVWEHELTLAGDGNWCFQEYTNNRTNSYVKNGVLYIKPTLTSAVIGQGAVEGNPATTIDLSSLEPAMQCTGDAFYGCSRTSSSSNYLNPIQSAALRTAKSFSFKYGRVEVRAKLPRGDWLWPAIWLLPRWAEYGQWPMSGEIDIMESRGNAPGYAYHGSDYFGSTLHWGPYYPQDPFQKTRVEYQLPAGKSFADDFHIFGLYWDSTGLYTYLDTDSNKVLKVNWTQPTTSNNYFYDLGQFNSTLGAANPWAYSSKGAPFDQEFYLILDVAVGGAINYFMEDANRPWHNDEYATKDFWNARSQWLPTWQGDDAAMQVDYVRVWQ